jgi:hypothetical protein
MGPSSRLIRLLIVNISGQATMTYKTVSFLYKYDNCSQRIQNLIAFKLRDLVKVSFHLTSRPLNLFEGEEEENFFSVKSFLKPLQKLFCRSYIQKLKIAWADKNCKIWI